MAGYGYRRATRSSWSLADLLSKAALENVVPGPSLQQSAVPVYDTPGSTAAIAAVAASAVACTSRPR